MSLAKSIYIGPYARCYNSKNGQLDHWANTAIMEKTGDERLYYANGDSIASPALFAPNVRYEGEGNFDKVVADGGEQSLQDRPFTHFNNSFCHAFRKELLVLEDFFDHVEVVFGVIVT